MQITTGRSHACALLISGNVRCWGSNLEGELGYGIPDNNVRDPNASNAGDVEITKSGTIINPIKVKQVVAASQHTCALLVDGTVRCWGKNQNGALGLGSPTVQNVGDDEKPSQVGAIQLSRSDVVQIGAGASHTCALFSTGNVQCWGAGNRLGRNDVESIGDNEHPSAGGIPPIGIAGTSIAVGNDFTCLVGLGGFVKCWGSASAGQLGYGDGLPIGDDELVTTVPTLNFGNDVRVKQIAAAGTGTSAQSHACALLENGRVKCWGSGASGKLGYGNTISIGATGGLNALANIGTVSLVSQNTLKAVQLTAGAQHTCALLEGGKVMCWGESDNGRLGYATGGAEDIGDNELPQDAGFVPVPLF
jgi:alpha-tubulin suppressor-like RCC1 family protein